MGELDALGSSKTEPGARSPVLGSSGEVGVLLSVSLRRVERAAGSRIGSVFGLKGLRVRREMVRCWEWRW